MEELTNQGVLFDLVGACDVADIVRLEILTTDNGTLVDGRRDAEANLVQANGSRIESFFSSPNPSISLA